jgi:Fe2+ transport system protein FeoA
MPGLLAKEPDLFRGVDARHGDSGRRDRVARADVGEAAAVKCSSCGREFTAEQADLACRGCGLRGGCHLVVCPWCGYEQALEPKWVTRLFGSFGRPAMHRRRRLRRHGGVTLPLNQLPTGSRAIVRSVSSDDHQWRRFMALGIRPGTTLVVEQRFPALVVTVGDTQVAMDFSAALVEVEPLPAAE